MGESFSKKSLYHKVNSEFLLPSIDSRCITIPYLKYVLFIPSCFRITLQEWEEFVL